MTSNYRIVTPSKMRSHNIPQLLSLVPSTTICVDEEEESVYQPVIQPPAELVPIPHKIDSISKTRQWCLDNFDEEAIIFIDDDLKSVRCVVGNRPRAIINPDDILQILLNSLQISKDLGISCFGYNRHPNPRLYRDYAPFKFNSILSSTWGIIGRDLQIDTRMSTREDFDITLQALLKDRIVLIDLRFYFEHGPIWSGAGGNQCNRTAISERRDNEILEQKWGSYINLNANKDRTSKGKAASINVKRKAI